MHVKNSMIWTTSNYILIETSLIRSMDSDTAHGHNDTSTHSDHAAHLSHSVVEVVPERNDQLRRHDIAGMGRYHSHAEHLHQRNS